MRTTHLFALLLIGVVAAGACRDDTDTKPVSSTSSGGGEGGGDGGGGSGTGGGGIVVGPMILAGTVLTPDMVFEGQVHVEADLIVCVAPGSQCSDADGSVPIVPIAGVIAPGLIDTHNHILFDIFNDDDWVPTLPSSCGIDSDCETSQYCSPGDCACVSSTCKYKDHTQWTDEDEYGLMLDYKQCLDDASQGKPVWCPQTYDGDGKLKCELLKWGELKGLVAGTTSIVGLPGNTSQCFGSLARSIDVPQNDLDDDRVQTSSTFPPSASSANGVCANFTDGDTAAYLIHVGEGVNSKALDEFATLFSVTDTDGCLYAPQTAITHGTAFGATEWATMASAGMKLTWSPASNVALYGVTTDIPGALAAGITISLGPDWSMGGSQNILEEMAFADAWDNANWGDVLEAKDVVEMVTTSAAAVLGLAGTIGRLEPGAKADLIVVAGGGGDAYESLVSATPAAVSLVMIDGVILYGDATLQPEGTSCESINICGVDKFLCAAELNSQDKLNQTYEDIRVALEAGLADLDGIVPLAPGACSPACASDEECFERTVVPQVSESLCPAPCGGGEACFQTAQSGNNQYNCLSINACSYQKTQKSFAPLSPLVACP